MHKKSDITLNHEGHQSSLNNSYNHSTFQPLINETPLSLFSKIVSLDESKLCGLSSNQAQTAHHRGIPISVYG